MLALAALLTHPAPAQLARETGPKCASSAVATAPVARPAEHGPLPTLLSQTGLYRPGSTTEIAPENRLYSPQYPLWSDAAVKRRWIGLPPRTQIDASNPEEWQFPSGTRFWKEFSFAGARVETRYLERLSDGTYRYASYVWDPALGDARLAPEGGLPGVSELAPNVQHDVPSREDCRVCHEGRSTPVLGFRALQLSTERDPLAPHREAIPSGSLTLEVLMSQGLLTNFPREWASRTPRIDAPSATARAAAGYLFANCAHCHNARGPLATLDLDLDQELIPTGYSTMLATVAGRASSYRLPGADSSQRVVPGRPQESALWFRMQSRFPAAQMPPLGTKIVDRDAVRLLDRFIRQM